VRRVWRVLRRGSVPLASLASGLLLTACLSSLTGGASPGGGGGVSGVSGGHGGTGHHQRTSHVVLHRQPSVSTGHGHSGTSHTKAHHGGPGKKTKTGPVTKGSKGSKGKTGSKGSKGTGGTPKRKALLRVDG